MIKKVFKCSAEVRAKQRAWHAKNPNAIKKWKVKNPERWDYLLQRARLKMYGLTENEYEILYKTQRGLCAICKYKLSTRSCIDHCHKSSKVRGLLCHKCNLALGLFQDSVKVISSAIKYLRKK